jgi:hypothetical protein
VRKPRPDFPWKTHHEHDPEPEKLKRSEPTAIRCGEKMLGVAELTQVKGGHWNVEVLAMIAAAVDGTSQSRFADTSLTREKRERVNSQQGSIHR